MAAPAKRATKKRPANRTAFRRYTNLAAAIHLLLTKQITLLDPASWDDKNDAHFMLAFKEITGADTVLAICFAETEETYHHWKVFSAGVDGVCIEFDKEGILSAFDGLDGVLSRKVDYLRIDTLRKRAAIDPAELPFLKREPYRPEQEYRVVYVEKGRELPSRDVPIEIGAIRRITLSPWMPPALRDSVAETLIAIPGCAKLKIARSTLVGNREWQAIADKAR